MNQSLTDVNSNTNNTIKDNGAIIDATMLKLETLETEYENTMKKYEEMYKTYINELNMSSTNNTPQYDYITNSTYWGTAGLKEQALTTQEECSALCSADTQCSGATFNPEKRYCWTRSGDGSVNAGQDADIAIVPQGKTILSNLKLLNNKLIELNGEIESTLKNLYPTALEEIQKKDIKKRTLNNLSAKLEAERLSLTKLMNEYNTLNESYEQTNLYTAQKNIQYRFWFLLAAIVLLVTVKKMFSPVSASMNFLFWIFLSILLLMLTFTLTTPQGYLFWLIVILILILVKLDIIPSPDALVSKIE
jgi:hypothetical protein